MSDQNLNYDQRLIECMLNLYDEKGGLHYLFSALNRAKAIDPEGMKRLLKKLKELNNGKIEIPDDVQSS